MKYEELEVGLIVADGHRIGRVEKIYKNTVHVRWSFATRWHSSCDDKWIYDLEHLQFLKEYKG